MEVQLGPWPAYECRPMPDASCDQITQARHDSDSQRSRSYGEEWQSIPAQCESSNGITAEDLAIFNHHFHLHNMDHRHLRDQNFSHNLNSTLDHLVMPPPMLTPADMEQSSREQSLYSTPQSVGGSMAPPEPVGQLRSHDPYASAHLNHLQQQSRSWANMSYAMPLRAMHFASTSYPGPASAYPRNLYNSTSDPHNSPSGPYNSPSGTYNSPNGPYNSPVSIAGYASAPSSVVQTPSPMMLPAPYSNNANESRFSTSPNFNNTEDDDGDSADPCYAQLLYQALKEAPNHTMTLRDLYEWVKTHSGKGKDPANKGWQNSVRHNLSMNQAFQRVNVPGNSGKKNSQWKLTDQALANGVISTTRFRKDPKKKVERHHGEKAPARVRSGAKGGQATRAAVRRLQHQRSLTQRQGLSTNLHQYMPQNDMGFVERSPSSNHRQVYQQPDLAYSSQPSSPYFAGEEDHLSNSMPAFTSNPQIQPDGAENYEQYFRAPVFDAPHGLPFPGQHYYQDEDAVNAYPTPNTLGGDNMPAESNNVSYGDQYGDNLGDNHVDIYNESGAAHVSSLSTDDGVNNNQAPFYFQNGNMDGLN